MGRPPVRGSRQAGRPSGVTTGWKSPVRATISTSTRGAVDDDYIASRREILDRYGLQVFAISAHLQGQAVCDDPIDQRHQGHPVQHAVWGDGEPEGVRQRAAEAVKNAARTAARLGVSTVVGFTGSSIWKYIAMFPPASAEMIDAGYQDFADRWNPILDVFDEVGVRFAHEVHPVRDRLRLLLHGAGAGGDRAPAGVRDQLGPVAHGLAEHRPGAVHLGLPRPDLPRRLQGHQGPDAGRPPRHPGFAPALGRSHAVGGTSCPPAAATSTGKTASGCSTTIGYDGPISIEWEDAGMDRLHGAPEALAYIRGPAFRPAGHVLRRRLLAKRLRIIATLSVGSALEGPTSQV